jgi:hypothetical protein
MKHHRHREERFLGCALVYEQRRRQDRQGIAYQEAQQRFVALRETPGFVGLAAHLRRVLETC